MTSGGAPDVIVVGGGVIGLSIAWRLAGSGARVEVFDPEGSSGASWAAAGMLAPVTEAHFGEERLLRLNLDSAARYPEFVEELENLTGCYVGYRRCGTLTVAATSDDHAVLDDLFRFQVSLGVEVQRLRGGEARELEPRLSPRIRSGILAPGDHQVDNRALLVALEDACRRSGVTTRRERVASLVVDSGCIAGVRFEADEERAQSVVIAAGARSGELCATAGAARVPIRPVKGQLVHLDGVDDDHVARNIRGLRVYIVGRGDGRVVVGATVEEQGFDTRVTAGGLYDLLRDATELLPGITEAEVVETIAGLRPATPDNAPVIGATDVEGLFIASGHYRNGILLAPVTADAIAALVTGGAAGPGVEAFSPQRFASQATPRWVAR
ncbi:MAG TPA: glycine oxidase ThiO [Actinomycetota bacterium]|nr:glycine oxidase ThiO [Actinomycetota bacterium]